MKRRDVTVAQRQSAIRNNAPRSRSLLEEDPTVAETKNSATKPTPEEKLAAAEAEVDALVAKGQQALVEFEKLDQKQVDHIVAKASVAALNLSLIHI